jgi:hypothetical protein
MQAATGTGRPVAGLRDRAAAKLAEVDARTADLTTIRTALLTACASMAGRPIHFKIRPDLGQSMPSTMRKSRSTPSERATSASW